MEIPIMLAVVGVVAALVLPHLSPFGAKVFIGIALLPVLYFLYYMIVIPGWMPSDTNRLRPPWSVVVFTLVAAAITGGYILFAFLG